MTRYNKGAVFERELIHRALKMDAQLALRGAGSKSWSNDIDLKVDLVVFRKPYIYLVQSKKGKNSRKERSKFNTSTAKLKGYWFVKSGYIEELQELDNLFYSRS